MKDKEHSSILIILRVIQTWETILRSANLQALTKVKGDKPTTNGWRFCISNIKVKNSVSNLRSHIEIAVKIF